MKNTIFHGRIDKKGLTRRDFIKLMTWATAGAAMGPALGCAVNPVTGEQQFMLVSRAEEIKIDKEYSPHQFSADYGVSRDRSLNNYLSDVGNNMAPKTHRPDMPYSFQAVNAVYVNAYAFPGGSIAATRGILLSLENEAELAALLGHELGHVNARHTGERMSKSQVIGLGVGLLSMAASTVSSSLGDVTSGVLGVGAGALLAHYSRDDERQADKLGMEYMTAGGYNPQGMVGLMDVLRNLNKREPNVIELMFSTHPMSDERFATAKERLNSQYSNTSGMPVYRERYMDNTASLRRIEGAIQSMQEGEKFMGREEFSTAETHLAKALQQAPDDYTGLVMMSKCQLAREKPSQARRYAKKAQSIYPKEAQAHNVSGIAMLMQKDYDAAYDEFKRYDQLLPGNPNITFLKGLSLEGMGNKDGAAEEYYQYLQVVKEGKQAQYAYNRLVEWGYIEPRQ